MLDYMLKTVTRLLTGIAGISIGVSMLGANASAQEVWPSRPIRIIVPSPAGGLPDSVARIITKPVSDVLGQPIVMDPKPGVAGNLAADLVAKSKPDGYTFLLTTMSTHGLAPWVFKSLPFKTVEDFAPVARLVDFPLVMFVNEQLPAKTLTELVAYAKANPGKLNYGSAGAGSVTHLAAAQLGTATGARLIHIPYKGYADVQQALRTGDLQLSFLIGNVSTPGGIPVAVASRARFGRLPNVPTFAEMGIQDVYMSNWYGFVAPAKTPQAILDRFADQIAIALKDPAVLERLQGISAVPAFLRTKEFETYYVSEIARLRPIVAAAGATGSD